MKTNEMQEKAYNGNNNNCCSHGKKVFLSGLLVSMTLLAVTLTGCGNSRYTGKWKVESAVFDGQKMTIADVEPEYYDVFSSLGIVINGDGTAESTLYGYTDSTVNWTASGDTITFYGEGSAENVYGIIHGNHMTVEAGGDEIVFRKE